MELNVDDSTIIDTVMEIEEGENDDTIENNIATCADYYQRIQSIIDNQVSQAVASQPNSSKSDDENGDGAICPICFDNWTNVGDHRLCSLKCGHLFGYSCILQWLNQKHKTCPTCNKKAVKADIRFIYAKKLIAVDTTEVESVKSQLTEVTKEKNQMQVELSKAVCREHLVMLQVEELKKKIKLLDNELENKQKLLQPTVPLNHNKTSTTSGIQLYMDKSLEICKEGGCRVLSYSGKSGLLVASVKSPNIFKGFGVRKIDIETYRPTGFIPLHTSSIRDIRFHSDDRLLLTVSLDKTIKIVDTHNNLPVFMYCNGSTPLWSCCWDVNNSHLFHVGQQSGSVVKFDTRQMEKPVSVSEIAGDISPVVSVASVTANSGYLPLGAIIVCKLNSLWMFENSVNNPFQYPLPVEGPFTSMFYCNINKHMLISTRSNSKSPCSRHLLCNIECGAGDNFLCNVIHSFYGSPTQKHLARSCIISNNTNNYVVAPQESYKSVFLWNIESGHKSSVPAHAPVLDVCHIYNANANMLGMLSEKKVEFFKFA